MLKEHDRRSLPEGAVVECLVVEQERGLQARKVLSIDLSTAVVPELGRGPAQPADRIDWMKTTEDHLPQLRGFQPTYQQVLRQVRAGAA